MILGGFCNKNAILSSERRELFTINEAKIMPKYNIIPMGSFFHFLGKIIKRYVFQPFIKLSIIGI
ncbi:hypothetical protein BWI92_24630 [Flectobacillus sp. BAB-3569]|nr:hypothetical protein BWI92_24630 [Flectobacillus sp. BAB-3569]